MNFYGPPGCDPELAAPANRRALTTSDLEQMVDDAAEYAGQANTSAERAEEVVASVDASIIVVDTAVAQAETYAQSAQEAQEGANSSASEATTQAANAGLSAASAAGSETAAQGYASDAQATAQALNAAKGQANGIAPLDASSKLPEVNVPTRLSSTSIDTRIGTVGDARYSGIAYHEVSAAEPRFGVKGDGTDETVAMQAFLDYIVTNGAHGVIPFRDVRISQPLSISGNRGWTLRGMGRYRGTNIIQLTDNVPIIRMGVGGGTSLRDWVISDICITYNTAQPAANTSANCIFFEGMPYQFELHNVYLRNGYYGIGYQAGVGGAWGGDWDGIIFGGMSGGWINMSGTTNSVPNNRFGRIYGDSSGCTDFLFKSFTGYNTTMSSVEVINHANGAGVVGNGVFDFTTGSSFIIGAFKIEGGRFTAPNVNIVNVPAGTYVSFGEFRIQASNGGMTVTPTSGDCTIFAMGSGGTAVATVDIGLLAITATSAGFLNGYVAKGGTRTSQVFIKRMDKTVWKLTNRASGALVSENMRIEQWMNKRLSADKGNASVTLTPGDETTLFFEAPFTATRDVNLPFDSSELIGGLAYRVYVAANVVNGGFNLRIVCPGVKVVYTKTTSIAEVITVEWRTTVSGAAGWYVTGVSPV